MTIEVMTFNQRWKKAQQTYAEFAQRAGLKDPPELVLDKNSTMPEWYQENAKNGSRIVVSAELVRLLMDKGEMDMAMGMAVGFAKRSAQFSAASRDFEKAATAMGATASGALAFHTSKKKSRRQFIRGVAQGVAIGTVLGNRMGAGMDSWLNSSHDFRLQLEADREGMALAGDPEIALSVLKEIKEFFPIGGALRGSYAPIADRIAQMEALALEQKKAPDSEQWKNKEIKRNLANDEPEAFR